MRSESRSRVGFDYVVARMTAPITDNRPRRAFLVWATAPRLRRLIRWLAGNEGRTRLLLSLENACGVSGVHTADAHGLYRQFGFREPNATYLERPGSIAP